MAIDQPITAGDGIGSAFQSTFVNTLACQSIAGTVVASTPRFGEAGVHNIAQEKQQLQIDAAELPSMPKQLLKKYYSASRSVGTKVAQLLQEIEAMVVADPKSKCVVFSQFTGVLDVASEELQSRGIKPVRVDGSVAQHERADALLDFQSDPEIRVFLLSMRAGAVGLTLTAADHCFILDTPTNAAVEEQAIDRIHRIGQLRVSLLLVILLLICL